MSLKFMKRLYRIGHGAIATTIMISVAPSYIILHSRIVAILLPRNFTAFFDDFLWGMYQKLILFFFEHMTGAEIIISGLMPQKKENAILICNHQCSVDWVVTDMIAERSIMTYFVVFPEGTRFSIKSTDQLVKSQAFAVQNGLRPLTQVLTPRVKAFHCAVSALQNYATAVYDATIVYEEKSSPMEPGKRCPAPNMWTFLLSPSPRIYIHINRIPLDEIPLEPTESTLSWLNSRFEQKDALIAQHFGLNRENGSDSAQSDNVDMAPTHDVLRCGVVSKLPLMHTLPSAFVLTSFTLILLSTRIGRMTYLSSVIGGSAITVLYNKIFF